MTTDNHGQSGPKFGVGVTRARVAEFHAKGLSQSEIGRVLKISREAVRQHLKRIADDAEKTA